MLKEVHDMSGQHEVIAENLTASIIKEATQMIQELKSERKKVGAQFVCRFISLPHPETCIFFHTWRRRMCCLFLTWYYDMIFSNLFTSELFTFYHNWSYITSTSCLTSYLILYHIISHIISHVISPVISHTMSHAISPHHISHHISRYISRHISHHISHHISPPYLTPYLTSYLTLLSAFTWWY